MLIGEFRHSIDEKGRTSLPALFKKEMGKVVYITRGLDGMIDVYTKKSWDILQEKLSQLPMTVKANRDFKRFILGASSELNSDKQGRILISQALREHAGILSGKVVWTGVGDKAEIWSEERWDKNSSENIENIESISASLDGII